MPQLYAAYDSLIQADVELPSLKAAEAAGGEPDVVIEEIDRPTFLDRWEAEKRTPGGSCVTSHYFDELFYAVEGGSWIGYYRKRSVTDDLLGRCLISLPIAVALRQKGLLALHACAVAVHGQVAVFIGPSGAGKSTLAEAFHQQGHEVICDDLFVARVGKNGAMALPGPEQIRLRPGSGVALVEDYESLPLAWWGTDQRYRTVRIPSTPLPVRRIYLIDGKDEPALSVEKVSENEAFISLSSQSWAYRKFTSPAYTVPHLEHLATLIRLGLVRRLRRIRSISSLESTVNFVECDVGSGK